jgi:uncharacterized protein Usg
MKRIAVVKVNYEKDYTTTLTFPNEIRALEYFNENIDTFALCSVQVVEQHKSLFRPAWRTVRVIKAY